jgi:hypothetical protein
MVNAYKWSPTTSAMSDFAAIASRREAREDVASVAQMWVAAAYDDLRRAGSLNISLTGAHQASPEAGCEQTRITGAFASIQWHSSDFRSFWGRHALSMH